MELTQAEDFLAESEALSAALCGLTEADFARPTQFKNWTFNDILVHLHFWNAAADLSARNPEAFAALLARLAGALAGGGLRGFENGEIRERGPALRRLWIEKVREMAPRWGAFDARRRLPWAGPDMSARSSMTARQMETWAHGMAVFDALGRARQETDRVKNIVVLGVNTFAWSHLVHGLEVPATMPALQLDAPSGAIWEYGDKSAGCISGAAVDFAAVVTQTRALADTGLRVRGAVAQGWMQHAQCFAGPPETPPAPGTRFRAGGGQIAHPTAPSS